MTDALTDPKTFKKLQKLAAKLEPKSGNAKPKVAHRLDLNHLKNIAGIYPKATMEEMLEPPPPPKSKPVEKG